LGGAAKDLETTSRRQIRRRIWRARRHLQLQPDRIPLTIRQR
jgi:hypothetical protein